MWFNCVNWRLLLRNHWTNSGGGAILNYVQNQGEEKYPVRSLIRVYSHVSIPRTLVYLAVLVWQLFGLLWR